ncbi:3'-5' exonuclease [Pseudoalteromonas rubra]|uniref:3'-5' exonuclease n=1 Tax=Pseudoalteromonas rubra TaxID=43658 RepID=A0A5S3WTR1_9GAMM|nr:3'-5' exonuclease [Pseudoalteromonas rubra]TMP30189.1 3'-5' exonuclease [Pseudoalteromonas rubra]TMP31942.1 3'-5' exonuclease [Pseudoalteromonas rubra]
MFKKCDYVVLDTETTGLDSDARICEISIIDMSGNVLLDTLINPEIEIPSEAIAIHGITNEMVAHAPVIQSVLNEIKSAISGKILAIYNADYDIRLLNQSLEGGLWDTSDCSYCVMHNYAEYYGEIGPYGDYKWQRLVNACYQQGVDTSDCVAHRALGDCQMTRLLMVEFMEFAG